MPDEYRLACVLLAAGESARFGSPKQIAKVNDKPMLVTSLKKIEASNIDSVFVALGGNCKLVEAVLPRETEIIKVENWQRGIGKSIAHSVRHVADAGFTHALIALSDQVAITTDAYNQLLEMSEANPKAIVAAKYAGIIGAPCIFPKTFFDELRLMDNDKGARSLLKQYSEYLLEVSIPEAGIDIDTPQELALWLEHHLDKS